MLGKIFKSLIKHKIISGIALIIIIAGGYFFWQRSTASQTQTTYSLEAVKKGAIITSVSGSGQVSASNEVAINPKVSGEVTAVSVTAGQEVKQGILLVSLDSRDAQKEVRDAQTSLETAKLDLEEILEPVDELTLLQAENSLTATKESKQQAEDNLIKSYDDGFNTIVSIFSDLPTVMTDLDDILYSNTINKDQDNIDAYVNLVRADDSAEWEQTRQYQKDAVDSYQMARTSYDATLQDYKLINRYSDNTTIEKIISETRDTTKKVADAIKDIDNLISFVKDYLTQSGYTVPTTITTHKTSINSDASKASSLLSSISSAESSIKNYKDSIISITRSIQEQELSLAKTKVGSDELTIRAKKIAVQQKQDALLSAQQTLADYYVRAPFDGVIAKVDVEKGDTASSGTSLATLVTQQEVAEISLNEVDVANIKVGQKSTLTFDAVADLSITGEVAEVDTIGTVSSGVVSYGVKITFDVQDDRVKSGMSVSATIITDTKQDVLLISSTAVKTQNNTNYVLIPSASENLADTSATTGIVLKNSPAKQVVEIGLSDDTSTEITSGLKEGDYVITKTTTSSASSSKSSSSNTNTNKSSSLFDIGAGGPPGR